MDKILEGRQVASVTINWKGKYKLFTIDIDETLSTFLMKLNESISNLKSYYVDEKGFYMLILGEPDISDKTKYKLNKLSYIGKAFNQNLRSRIPQKSGHESAFKCIISSGKGYTLYLGLGKIIDKSIQKETSELYDDIENCLVFTNQPECNENLKATYNSLLRRELSIKNIGNFKPLKENTNCK